MPDPKIEAWAGSVVSGGNLDATTYGQGTSYPSTWPTTRMFWRTDEKILYQNTGTVGTPVWTAVGSAPEYSTLVGSNATFTPTKQTGDMGIIIDNTNGTNGGVAVKVDGTTVETATAGQIKTRLVTPTTSVSIATSHDFGVNSNKTTLSTSSNALGYSDMRGFCMSDDGTKMIASGYLTWYWTRNYTLSTPYDITSASIDYNRGGNSGNAGYMGGEGMYYIDSSKVLLIGGSGGSIWDLNNHSIANSTTQSSLNAGLTHARGGWIGDSGTKACFGGQGAIKMYDLSSAYDLGTASLANTSSITWSHVMAIQLNDNGTMMAVWSSNTMYVYTLSTAYDVSTATLTVATGGYSGVANESASIMKADVGQMAVGGRYNYLKHYSFDTGYAGTAKVKVG